MMNLIGHMNILWIRVFGYEVYDMNHNTYDISVNETLLFKMARDYVNTLIAKHTRS